MKRLLPVLLAAAVLAAPCWYASRQLGGLMRALAANPFQWNRRVAATGPVVVEQVQRLRRLETCRFNGQVVVRGERKGLLPTWLAGDRMLFVGRGEVVAGLDLGALGAADVQVRGDGVTIRLPDAEVLHTRLDNRSSQVHERQSGLFTGADRALETDVRIEAEERLRQAAVEGGVLATARANGEEAVRRQLELLGFSEVRFL